MIDVLYQWKHSGRNAAGSHSLMKTFIHLILLFALISITQAASVSTKLTLDMSKAEVIKKCGKPFQVAAFEKYEVLTYREIPFGARLSAMGSALQGQSARNPSDSATYTYVYLLDEKVVYFGNSPELPKATRERLEQDTQTQTPTPPAPQLSPSALADTLAQAAAGDIKAQMKLAALYYLGKGVPKDPAEAAKWWRLAADKGLPEAQCFLAKAYMRGEGVPKDDAEAAKLLRKAAEQGDAEAQFGLGLFHVSGQAVAKDNVEAYKWLNLAAAQGHKEAPKMREICERRMTPDQIAEAQRLSREFIPRSSASDGSAEAPSEEHPAASATGFFITPEGYLVTNDHVTKAGTKFKIVTAHGTKLAQLVKTDSANDLALLKVEGAHNCLPVAPSRGVKLGQSVATIGFPNIGLQGFSPKLARGDIASLAGAQDDARHFQISVPVQPGNSGGPLVDLHGNVVGVIVGKLNQTTALRTSGTLAENVNYAIKSTYLLSLLESLPAVAGALPDPATRDLPFEEMVTHLEKATVLVLVYR